MGRITNQYFGEGQAPTAPQLNAVYSSVAGDDVEDVNLDTAVSYTHLRAHET